MLFCSFAAATLLIGGAGYGDISQFLIGWSPLAGLPSPDFFADSAPERPPGGTLPVGETAVAFESGIRVGERQSIDRHIEKTSLLRILDSFHTKLASQFDSSLRHIDLFIRLRCTRRPTVISTTTNGPGIEIGNEHSYHAGLDLQSNA